MLQSVNHHRVGNFDLIEQVSAGPDGRAFRARDTSSGITVELCLLADSQPWQKRVRLAALLKSQLARPVLAHQFDAPPYHVARSWTDAPRLSEVAARGTLRMTDAVRIVRDLAVLLTECHHWGLLLGNVGPDSLRFDESQSLLVDVLGVDLGAARDRETLEFQKSPRELIAPEDDVAAVGQLLAWLLTRSVDAARDSTAKAAGGSEARSAEFPNLADQLAQLYSDATRLPPESRLLMADFQRRLDTLYGRLTGAPTYVTTVTAAAESRLGRFRMLEKLGAGGMGEVFKAEDLGDGSTVAVKTLNLSRQGSGEAVARFRREARVLAEINSPYVARLLETNEDAGVHYIVMEYVDGVSLSHLLEATGALSEETAVRIASDVAKALSEAHSRGIIHRDVKPANILLQGITADQVATWSSRPIAEKGSQTPTDGTLIKSTLSAAAVRVKLVDFGLARRVAQEESIAATRTNMLVGTPAYMAPEQTLGKDEIDARADVYALGITLYEMLCGRLPFAGSDTMTLAFKHSYEQAPRIQELNPRISDGAARIVEKCLAKRPDARYDDARPLLDQLQGHLRGEPTNMQAHPVLPPHDPQRIFTVDWHWDLEASPAELWPLVSNTERINRAANVPSVEYKTEVDPTRGVRRFGEFRLAGQSIVWEEHPYEWIEGRRMAIFRQFSKGPFYWFLSTVELQPRPGGGTRLSHRVRIDPRGLVGRFVAWMEVKVKGFKALDRTYRRIDATVSGRLTGGVAHDAFESPARLDTSHRRRLQERLGRLVDKGLDLELVDKFGQYLTEAAPQELARIRPIPLARRLAFDSELVVRLCLLAVREGLLLLHWDILCPSCRSASQIKDTLKEIQRHAHCEACNLDFDVDLAKSVEMIFQVHPEVRHADLGTYCIGGPEHYPHVIAQVRLQPQEMMELELELGAGDYALRGPQLAHAVPLTVQPQCGVVRWEVDLGSDADTPPILRSGSQVLGLVNRTELELLVRLERMTLRHDAVTAAQAASMPDFRELFPGEVLSADQMSTVANTTFVFVHFTDSGPAHDAYSDAEAYRIIRETTAEIERCAADQRGAVVSHERDGLLAAFAEATDAIGCAIELWRRFDSQATSPCLPLRYAVHRGAALVITRAGQLDYFGSSVTGVVRLASQASDNDLWLSAEIAADPLVAAAISAEALVASVHEAGVKLAAKL